MYDELSMICEACRERQFKKILDEADKAMERYTKKLRKESKCLNLQKN